MRGSITLTSSMRANLLNLQKISNSLSRTQNQLSMGKKVNSAIDNPSFFAAQSLTARARDLNALLDSMGEAISTIKAATTSLGYGVDILEQAASIATQTLGSNASSIPSSEFEKEGYKVITSDMSAKEINDLITDNAKLVLASDIVLDSTINITAKGVKINGNGYKITFSSPPPVQKWAIGYLN